MAYQVSSIINTAYSPVAPPVPPPSSRMPSTTTTYITSAVTSTAYVTAQPSGSAVPQKCDNDIIGTVQKLPQSVQSFVFEAISGSKCSPCDYPCICTDLHTLDVAGKVSKGCSTADYETYMAFEKNVCSAPAPYPSSVIITTSIPGGCNPAHPGSCPTPAPAPPANNGTQELTTYTTTTVCPVTTDGKVTETTSTITVTSCKAGCTAPPAPPASGPPASGPPASAPPASGPPASAPPAAGPPAPPAYPTGNNATTVTSTDKLTSTIQIPGSTPPAAPGSPAGTPGANSPAAPGSPAGTPGVNSPAAPGSPAGTPGVNSPAAPGSPAATPGVNSPAAPGSPAATPGVNSPAAPGSPAGTPGANSPAASSSPAGKPKTSAGSPSSPAGTAGSSTSPSIPEYTGAAAANAPAVLLAGAVGIVGWVFAQM